MILKSLRVFAGVLVASCALTEQVAAETWVDTDTISNSRNLQIQINIDSIVQNKGWIYFFQRIKDLDDTKAYKPWKTWINCSKGELVNIFSNSEKKTQFRRNGKWFIDFVSRNDPSDVFSMEVDAQDDAYREKTYTLICKKYNIS